MEKEEAILIIIENKSNEWNNYRKLNPGWEPDLSKSDLSKADLVPSGKPPFNLSKANLCGTKLPNEANRYRYRRKNVNMLKAIFDTRTEYPSDVDLTEFGAILISKTDFNSHIKRKPTVFISYTSANEAVVNAIEQWLRNKGVLCKIDKRDFLAGSRIRDEIMRIMAICDVILIFYSKESRDKPWPQFERELASDLEIEAKKKDSQPPRIIYLVIDDTELPSIAEKNRIAILAKGKLFGEVCEELYKHILQMPQKLVETDLNDWKGYVF